MADLQVAYISIKPGIGLATGRKVLLQFGDFAAKTVTVPYQIINLGDDNPVGVDLAKKAVIVNLQDGNFIRQIIGPRLSLLQAAKRIGNGVLGLLDRGCGKNGAVALAGGRLVLCRARKLG